MACRVVLLQWALAFVPSVSPAQPAAEPGGPTISVAVLPGYFSGYEGGESYLVSASWAKAGAIPLEAAFEYAPTSYGSPSGARIFWAGAKYPRGLTVDRYYGGARVGYLDGPFSDGFLADVHAGLQMGGRGPGFRLEPALLVGFDESAFVGARLAAGLSWTFD